MIQKTFRSKVVLVDAVRFTDDAESGTEIEEWINRNDGSASWWPDEPEIRARNGELVQFFNAEHIKIRTLEGVMRASVGDWVIRGTIGEFYPCRSEVFDAKYEEVTSESEAEDG